MSLGRNIKRLRLKVGLQTQKALAEKLGIPQPQVSDWENDRYSVLEVSTLVKLAKAFRCSVDQLLMGADPDYDRVREARLADAAAGTRDDSRNRRLPDIPVVPEGDPDPVGVTADDQAHDEHVLGWLPRPWDLLDPNAYGIRIGTDSMRPAYRPNMIAILSPSCELRDGDEAYVQLASGERIVRVVRPVRGRYLMQAYNPTCKPRFVRRKEVKALHVIVYSRRHLQTDA